MGNPNVIAILRKQLEDARAEHRKAKEAFDFMVYNLPTGLPNPDGTLSIKQSGENERAALKAYMDALNRFSDFVMTGRVPEDLHHLLS